MLTASIKNLCGECTLCCTLFKVDWLEKPENTPCIHCDTGCAIHNEKPKECTDFNCSYIQSSVDNENMRPDKCGIIFEMLTGKIFFGTVSGNVSYAGYRQVENFLDQGFSVVLSKNGEPEFIINDRHKESEIRKEFSETLNGNL